MMSMGANTKKQSSESGIALIVTLIVVSVVISIGLSVLDLTTKQLRLSTNAKDSEKAFHAANAGLECARYWHREKYTDIEVGGSISPKCFGKDSTPSSILGTDNEITTSVSGDGRIYQYEYKFTWGAGSGDKCSSVRAVMMASSVTGSNPLVWSDVKSLFPGYSSNSNSKTCAVGSRCSIISVKGYNKSCGNLNDQGVTEREVLLEF